MSTAPRHRMNDALEILSQQHRELDELVRQLAGATDRAALVHDLVGLVTAHLAAEQEILYPAAGSFVSDQVMCEVMIEHVSIKRVCAELVWLEADDPRFDARIDALTALLDGHVQWQEHALFETVGGALDTTQRALLGAKLRACFAISLDAPVADAA